VCILLVYVIFLWITKYLKLISRDEIISVCSIYISVWQPGFGWGGHAQCNAMLATLRYSVVAATALYLCQANMSILLSKKNDTSI
jgi:hypothetical protein